MFAHNMQRNTVGRNSVINWWKGCLIAFLVIEMTCYLFHLGKVVNEHIWFWRQIRHTVFFFFFFQEN